MELDSATLPGTISDAFVRQAKTVYDQIVELLQNVLRYIDPQAPVQFSSKPHEALRKFDFWLNGLEVTGRSKHGNQTTVVVQCVHLCLDEQFTIGEYGLNAEAIKRLHDVLTAAVEYYDPAKAIRCARILAQIVAIHLGALGHANVTDYRTSPTEPDAGYFVVNGVKYGLHEQGNQVQLHADGGHAAVSGRVTDGQLTARTVIRLTAQLREQAAANDAPDQPLAS